LLIGVPKALVLETAFSVAELEFAGLVGVVDGAMPDPPPPHPATSRAAVNATPKVTLRI